MTTFSLPLPSPLYLPNVSRQKPSPQPSSLSFHLLKNNNLQIKSLKDRVINLIDEGQIHQAISTLDAITEQHSVSTTASNDDHHLILTSYSLILKSCIRFRNFKLGKLVHSKMAQSQLELDSVIINSLISLYSKSGDIKTAESIFENMGDNRDVVSWSAMISCYANNGMVFEALITFLKILELGEIYQNEYLFTTIIRACSNSDYVSIGKMVFGLVIKTGFVDSDVFIGCSLIDLFAKGANDLNSAYKVFDKMPERNLVTWTLMITRFAQMGDPKNAINLFTDMLFSGFQPDPYTLSSVVFSCTQLENFDLGQQLHSWIVRSGLVYDVCVGCSLVDMYAKCIGNKSMQDSRNVFNQMPDHNVISWTSIITGYVQNGGCDREAIELYYKMIHTHVVPNHFTFSSVLKACGNLSDSHIGEQIFTHSVKLGLASVNCVGNSVISMFARSGKTEDARKAFDILFEKNLISYNTMVDAYSKSSSSDQAFELLNQIEDRKIGVDAFTYASLLSGAASIGALSKGEQIHGRLLKMEIDSNLFISNALISMYSRCGSINDAFNVFQKMESRNVVSWTSIITGFAKHGFAKKALELFNNMIDEGVKPNEITYIAVLSACSHAGLVSEGRKHFNSMLREHGIVPKMEHYACKVDLLARSGLLSEAIEFINSMPIKPDALVWRTLLGACQVHGNTKLGEYAAKMILDLDPNDPAAYILLSNLYASTGQWEGVVKIRKSMKERNLIKDAGCSWIEVENTVHKFYVGDTLHARSREIYDELDQIISKIKKMGYVPNTDFVLHDVEEERKEQYLLQHSEKIAVVFGLINTSKSKPIRVFKNLRVCGDCHNAIKYISMATKREIVLRDSNRFHHFKEGICSCNDYW